MPASMPETAGFFPAADGTPLYGVYHAPETPPTSPPDGPEGRASGSRVPCPPDADWKAAARGAVVIAPPLFEERKSAYGTLTELARALAAGGYGVLRFDYRGSGESGGAPGMRRWVHLSGDLDAACTAARGLSGGEKVSLLGVRLSATLILSEAGRFKPERIVAVAPVLNGSSEVRLWRLRSRMRTELSGGEPGGREGSAVSEGTEGSPLIDLDGFPVHPGFLDDLQHVDLPSSSVPLACPTLLVQVSHRDTPTPEYRRLASALGPQGTLSCIKALPFWERVEHAETIALRQQVLAFLGATPRSGG